MSILANSRKKAAGMRAAEKLIKKRTGANATRAEAKMVMKATTPKPKSMVKRVAQAIGRGIKRRSKSY